MMSLLEEILQEAIASNASDIHITVDKMPYFRIDGKLIEVPRSRFITEEENMQIIQELNISETNIMNRTSYDSSYEYKENRMRVHLYRSGDHFNLALRLIPKEIPSVEQIHMPETIKQFTNLHNGLVLVTGVTGSGKTTTLASLIKLINENERKNIITIEDPIEYVYEKAKCLVTQRQIGVDVENFSEATKQAMREDPDIIVLGEMRDLETIKNAITLAETGHLVFATLHTKNAPETFNRIIDVFPAAQQNQMRFQLSSVIEGIISQRLIESQNFGRVPMAEVLVINDAVRNLVREQGNPNAILDHIHMNHKKNGSQTYDQSLMYLLKNGYITTEVMKKYCKDEDSINRMLFS